ncbi:Hypothetical predicted protein [Octopus vulgaris]|uniref:Uncharacterized protein n=1 Tax=Octopus vulgaris TaxID=6645 RepID=A0AA36BTR6_OCTVU|nr:Hypothetical predicted protein [Octopus vulgaris]
MHHTMAIFAHLHSFPIILLLCCSMVLITDGVPLTTTVKPKPITSTPTPHTGPYLETANESQVTDVVLGVLSAVLGAVVISTSAFYLCKKYQRNQRILRFYREAAEVDTNPFGVIYVYFDDSTTNSNIGSD